ncbi:SDR family NAD(P)-dependent oxidoreductase [Lysinibacillus sp. GbtcB16]|uniref:SDR family NAD(P)-dependent oxidoreductase n=1 Tax=Lysinibacillus sp. GbtcB16 TaxID=2824761 RepID=UPI0020C6A487|nr:SDR family oxidoreductase [Lysinibacillus sp. GbtcB16]
MNNLFSLDNKVAIVTGGAGYLGSAMTEALLEQGAIVYIASRNKEKNSVLAKKLDDKYKNRVHVVEMDVTNTESVINAIKYVYTSERKIDIIVNNSYSGKTGDLLSGIELDWIDSFDTSIHATYRVTKAVLPYMLKQNSGSIINIASMYGLVSPDPSIYGDSLQNSPPHYGAGKAGIVQLTKYLAGHFGSLGIRANCIAPGPFPHPSTQENKEFIKQLANKNPMKRIGQPEELKGITVLLASDASSYINGQTISVDGGWTIW